MTAETHPDIRRTVLFLRRGNELLLAMKKRGFGEGKYNGVGGKLEAGETLEQATIRECQEEIGVTPRTFTAVAELDFIQDVDENPWHMYVYAYLCDEWQGEPTESEEMAPQWYTIDTIPYQQMWDDDIHWLPRVLKGEKLTGTFYFDSNDTLTSHDITTVDTLPHQQ